MRRDFLFCRLTRQRFALIQASPGVEVSDFEPDCLSIMQTTLCVRTHTDTQSQQVIDNPAEINPMASSLQPRPSHTKREGIDI